MPRPHNLPRVHQLQIEDDESRLLGLQWDKMIAEIAGDLSVAIEYAACIRTHIEVIQARLSEDEFHDFLLGTKRKFDALWEIHGCGCGNPNCEHSLDNPDNDLGGFSGQDIHLH